MAMGVCVWRGHYPRVCSQGGAAVGAEGAGGAFGAVFPEVFGERPPGAGAGG